MRSLETAPELSRDLLISPIRTVVTLDRGPIYQKAARDTGVTVTIARGRELWTYANGREGFLNDYLVGVVIYPNSLQQNQRFWARVDVVSSIVADEHQTQKAGMWHLAREVKHLKIKVHSLKKTDNIPQ